ncbi:MULTISPECIES: DUF202 domain-containing protein [Tenebrionibacter/Tenebrionicola group]|jgi:hypothetical protein|uniref:DUF202 domain-containing protein n=2 Tax=Tenebrionibacter/Tenebrionicola group TaxID=2969848 RepID=A0A8K0V276_9ENTR|nr:MULTISPECIES: DUF202 domain-containing protein [Tenebrionibacter/Tenebrionicola group]MBK4715421.1 DUF202 domain-containing protein [Tenebrionibacter intestinalis]MBV4413961.1 DUF202 domain-containing protein [Tenebrionicola larvae]MBV5096089.1 DUF202 domain-containing protein [Tenebrionicola larvae]
MPGNRRARRLSDPGLQPERTSLAWFRTLLGYGALMALALRHAWYQAGILFWTSLAIVAVVALLVYGYARQRNLMDIAIEDFAQPGAVRARLLIALGVLLLAILFAVSHVRQVMLLWG